MSENQVTTASFATRRIQLLMLAVAVTCGAYVGGWNYMASLLDRETVAMIDSGDPVTIACPDRSVGGFPFRIGVSCSSFTASDPAGAFQVKAGALRTTAVVYDPSLILASLQSPAQIEAPAGVPLAALTWERARASVDTSPADDQLAGIEFDAPQIRPAAGGLMTAESLALFARPVAADADLALKARAISLDPSLVGGRQVAPFGLDLDVRLAAVEETWFSGAPGARSGVLNRLAILITDDAGLIADGPFTISAEGALTGRLSLRIVDVDAVIAALRTAAPDQAPMLEAMAAARPKGEGPADEWTLTIDIEDGNARLGFLPLGRIPPIAF